MAWDPAYHPRDKRGRFTRSATRTMSQADRNRGRKAMTGFAPVRHTDAGAARDYLEGIDTPESPAAKAYFDGGWRDTNTALRAGKTPDGVDELDQGMRPLPDDLMLRRQVPLSLFGNVPMKDLEGRKVRDAAYASTSLDVAGQEPGGTGVVTMHIAAPKGTQALVNAADGEILLARDTEVAITRVEPDGQGGWDVYGAVLPKVKPRGKTKPDTKEPKAQPAEPPAEPPATEPPVTPATPPPVAPDAPAAPEPAPTAPPAAQAAAAATGADALAAAPEGLHRPDNGLADDEAAGLTAYQDGHTLDYQGINAALRGGPTSDKAQKAIDGIDAAMAKSALTSDVTVYRGVRRASKLFGQDRFGQNLTGMQWREDAYVSTAVDKHVTDNFASPSQTEPLRMTITVPAGTSAVDLSDPDDPSEQELLLNRGHTLEVTADRGVINGVREIDVTVIPAPTTAEPDKPAEPAVTTDRPAPATGKKALAAAPLNLVRRGNTDPAMTPDRRYALNGYKRSNFSAINAQLRDNGDKPELTEQIRHIDEAMAASPLTEDVMVFRGRKSARRAFGDRVSGDVTGMVWREDAYVSTSANEATAQEFAQGGARNAGLLMRIVAPKGVGGIALSAAGYESEILLDRGYEYRVAKDHGVTGDGVRVVDVEMLPAGGPR